MFDRDFPGRGKTAGIIGVPLGFGAGRRGSGLGTRTMRQTLVRDKRLDQLIAELGYEVRDYDDVDVPHPVRDVAPGEHPKFLAEMREAVGKIVPEVRRILEDSAMPVILGGDHSIELPTFTGISSYFQGRGEECGLIWFDAHADINTPETSPSGNLHGMPLAHLFGRGLPEFVNLEGFAPKLNPKYFVQIGARDLDLGEKQTIREMGLNFFTMHDIDRRGMAYCVEKAVEIASQASGGFAVTFDVDVLDPIDAPGSGTLVRGGISYREAHLALEIVAESDKMRSFEIVEVNPMLDTHNRTSELAIELILSALGKTIL